MKLMQAKTLLLICLALAGLRGTLPAQSDVVYHVSGKIFLDTIGNCSYDVGEPPVPGVQIRLRFLPSGLQVWSWSPPDVNYYPMVGYVPTTDTLVQVYTIGLQSLGGGCAMMYEFPLTGVTDSFKVDFAIRSGDCPLMSVDISGLPPQPCFDRNYGVRYCNSGLDTAQEAYVLVSLDPNLAFQSSSIPGTALPGNTWRFEVGDMAPFDCQQFTITYQLDCAVPPGQVICSEALVYPDTFCQPSSGWSDAVVLAQALCEGDSVNFTLTNIGDVATTPDLGYVIAEDLIMYKQDVFSLDPSASIEVGMPANGATWHLSAEQEPNYPGGGYTNATIEGCGDSISGGATTGVFLIYPFSPGRANGARECREAVGSYDPNDIQGLPVGYGDAHLIRADDEIRYQIRFQNTGTDTAYTVTVRETLPAGLDPLSVIPGAASHPYTFSMNQNGLMAFVFQAIHLPDSAANQAGSNGFINYRARPLADLPDGSVIAGAAGIYFDFNPPITTNVVFHTIGEDFIVVQVKNTPGSDMQLEVFPNPAAHEANLLWKNHEGQPWQAEFFDALGRPVKTLTATGDTARLDCRALAAGVYFFRVRAGQQLLATGKIIVL